MRSYRLLRDLVQDCGATLIEEQPDPKVPGRVYAFFAGRTETLFRMYWNNKDRCGGLQVQAPDGTWEDMGLGVRKTKSMAFTHLHAFMVTAERLAGTRHD